MFKLAAFDAILKMFLGSGLNKLTFVINPSAREEGSYVIDIISPDKGRKTASIVVGCAGSKNVFQIDNFFEHWR